MAQPQVPKISSFERTLETVVVASKKISTFPTHIFEESSGGRRLFDRFIYSRVSNKGTCTTIYFSEKIHPVSTLLLGPVRLFFGFREFFKV